MAVKGYDIIGNVAVVKFSRGDKASAKKKFALKLLKERKSVTTVLEKADKFKGRLRTQSTKWIAGEKTKEALYKENGCVFRVNVDTCYFSPRLASERLEVARKVKRGENVLVMFGGVAPFAIVIGKHSKADKIVSVELGRACSKYAKENVRKNKLSDRIEVVQGDVRKVVSRDLFARELDANRGGRRLIRNARSARSTRKEKFDRIVMPCPQLKDSFLDAAFSRIKKNGVIHYYGFYFEEDVGSLKELVLSEAKKSKKKVKIVKIKKAGDVGIRKFRWRVDLKVLG